MNHRIVSTVVMIIVAFFVGAVALFAGTATSVAPAASAEAPKNPHPPSRRTASCLECHNGEQHTIPSTHRNFDLATCASCHVEAMRVIVPHTAAMGDARCPLCHGEPARDHGIPVSHLRYESGECLLCHPGDPANYDKQPSPAGLSKSPAGAIPHALDGVFAECSGCHFVTAKATLPENHRDFPADSCGGCHDHEPAEAGAGK
ncbi:MAG: hypothetical protein D9V44_09330 [Actinobacteria bacterium]|nr:MAG: hypothetical protein D9V44_09330 [Actinomycetota bacterium]